LFGLLLAAATLIAYWPALRGQFVWDDESWTSEISGLLRSAGGLWTMWSKPTALQQYYPLTATSFWLDYHLWRFWTVPYHVENVLLHVLAALLFWRLLRQLLVPGAWLATAVFALHPLMVESAAWITERKNVLSLVLYLAALLAYGKFTRFWPDRDDPVPDAVRVPKGGWTAYAAAFFLFGGALLAKATAFSLPAAVLLLCWWKRGRIRWRADVLPTLPFFALSAGLGLFTAFLEQNHVGAKGPEWALAFPERCLIAGRALWFYAAKLLWPANLCFVYPRWPLNPGAASQWLYPVAAAATLIALWLGRKKLGRGPVTAVLFFVGTLFPVLGFMNAYFMRYSFVCDHWVYLSSLGLIALGAGALVRTATALRAPALPYAFGAVLLPLLGLMTWHQSGMYTDKETLWTRTLAANPQAFLAQINLGQILFERGQLEEAIACFRKALEIHPGLAEAYNDLGNTLLKQGRAEEAITDFQKALSARPDFADAWDNLGVALLRQGRTAEAKAHFQRALELRPDCAEAHNNLGNLLLQEGQTDAAISRFRQALDILPDFAEANYSLAISLVQIGRTDEAVSRLRKAVEIQPQDAQAHNWLGVLLFKQGRGDESLVHLRRALQIDPTLAGAQSTLGDLLLRRGQAKEAITRYQTALELAPNSARVLNNFAWVLATCPDSSLRDGAKAVGLAQRAGQISGQTNVSVLGTLAAAQAEVGKFDQAVMTAQRGIELALAQGDAASADNLRKQAESYRLGLPFRDNGQTNVAGDVTGP
jgi:tetratricopeptide (TPR) repeat protein